MMQPGAPPPSSPGRARPLFILAFTVGMPILLVVWVYVSEFMAIDRLGDTNPMESVAATLMAKADHELAEGQAVIRAIAADAAFSRPGGDAGQALAAHGDPIRSGHFRGLRFSDGRRQVTVPEQLPQEWEPAWALGGGAGLAPTIAALPDGHHVVVIDAPVGAVDGHPVGWVTGLLDVEQVLGGGLVDRMQVDSEGEVFLADPEGRIFLSVNRQLLGRTIADLNLDASGRYWSIAGSQGWEGLAPTGWHAGVVVTQASVAQRNRKMKQHVAGIIGTIFAVSVGLAFVLWRSMRARRTA